MGMSPTQRTLKHYRGHGYIVGITEHWNPHAFIRQDLFGFIDVLAITATITVAIQATSTGNMGARVNKILALPAAKLWAQGKKRYIIVIGWKKYKEAVERKFWRPTVTIITREDFDVKTRRK